ncbi:MAG: hypothetical protein IPG23_19160 [Burkholderiales bacterium]|nr:hypothetical protein [Burkholderiales bacterium]
MTFAYQITVTDPNNVGGALLKAYIGNVTTALEMFQPYLTGKGTLIVNIKLDPGVLRAAGGPSAYFDGGEIDPINGKKILVGAGLYKMMTGNSAGGASDLTILLNEGGFRDQATLFPGVTSESLGETASMVHELLHGFGMSGIDPGGINQSESRFDSLIDLTNLAHPKFTGLNASSVAGGPFELLTGVGVGSDFYHLPYVAGERYEDVTTGIYKNGPHNFDVMTKLRGQINFVDDSQKVYVTQKVTQRISALDIAILKDIGYTVSDMPPTGVVRIHGAWNVGQTLTAVNSLSDADGMGTVSYQWFADGVAILGASSNKLTLAEAQIGKSITTIASYTDGSGIKENIPSFVSTGAIASNIAVQRTGTSGNDLIATAVGAEVIDGGDGIDTLSLDSFSSSVYVDKVGSTMTARNFGDDQIDTLINVERVKFWDKTVAYDLDGNAGKAALLIGAAVGASAITGDTPLVAAVLKLFDDGATMSDLTAAVVKLPGLALLAGGGSPEMLASYF